jgi:hypothetical protein
MIFLPTLPEPNYTLCDKKKETGISYLGGYCGKIRPCYKQKKIQLA